MKRLLLVVSLLTAFLATRPTLIRAQSCSIEPSMWSVTPSSASPGDTVEIEITNSGFVGTLWVVIDPYREPVSGTFKAKYILDPAMVVNPPGSARQSFILPDSITNGEYGVFLFRTFSWADQCSGAQTLTISGGSDPSEDPVGCLSIDDACQLENPDLDPPLCNPDTTYCKLLDFLTGYSAVQPKGQLLSACLRTGERYTCESGIPNTQDETCLCQPQTTPSYDTALVVSTGCTGGKGFVSSAIGCIPYLNPSMTTQFFLRWSLGVGGGVALFLIAVSAVKIMTVKGDVRRLQDAKDTLSSATAGLVLILLSVFLLRFISEQLIQLF